MRRSIVSLFCDKTRWTITVYGWTVLLKKSTYKQIGVAQSERNCPPMTIGNVEIRIWYAKTVITGSGTSLLHLLIHTTSKPLTLLFHTCIQTDYWSRRICAIPPSDLSSKIVTLLTQILWILAARLRKVILHCISLWILEERRPERL